MVCAGRYLVCISYGAVQNINDRFVVEKSQKSNG